MEFCVLEAWIWYDIFRIFEWIAIQVLYKHFRGGGVWGHAYFVYLGGVQKSENDLKNEDNLKNGDSLKNEDDLRKEDNFKNKDGLKVEDHLKNGGAQKS